MSSNRLNDAALAQLFLDARTANGFTDEPVAPELLQQIYDLAKMGPTSMNCQPARFVFLTTPEARERLLPYLMEGNKAKTLHAPVCVIVATDTRFHEHMDKTWHDPSGQQLFAGNEALAAATAQRNGTLSLPAITLNWWNVTLDHAEQASVPVQTLHVSGVVATAPAPPAPPRRPGRGRAGG